MLPLFDRFLGETVNAEEPAPLIGRILVIKHKGDRLAVELWARRYSELVHRWPSIEQIKFADTTFSFQGFDSEISTERTVLYFVHSIFVRKVGNTLEVS